MRALESNTQFGGTASWWLVLNPILDGSGELRFDGVVYRVLSFKESEDPIPPGVYTGHSLHVQGNGFQGVLLLYAGGIAKWERAGEASRVA
jgi:hypothetical protein